MSRTQRSREELGIEYADAIERDWQRVQNENPAQPFDRLNSPFSPAEALSYAEGLSQVQSEDAAYTFMMCNQQGMTNFIVAAHFAYPYLPTPKDEADKSLLRFGPPYVALAKAVAGFLKSLKPQPEREQRYD